MTLPETVSSDSRTAVVDNSQVENRCRLNAETRKTALAAKASVKDVSTIDLGRFRPGHREAIRARLEAMPQSYRNRYLKALRGRSLSTAVEAFCHECVGWAGKDEVRQCTSVACPLYPYRPGADE